MKIGDTIIDLHGNHFELLGFSDFGIQCPLLPSTNSNIILTKDIISDNTLILQQLPGDPNYGIGVMYNVHHKFYFKLQLRFDHYDESKDIRKAYKKHGKKNT